MSIKLRLYVFPLGCYEHNFRIHSQINPSIPNNCYISKLASYLWSCEYLYTQLAQ
ncbi:unnamed protein product [Acanthoscelides obtectus]|uniref:Uncharacterized protein n=1 Tax=Acanthoscelides obtectus TaxID=200917 RepID=A0A9P0QFW1_ACAOB|nr:unnamed protein product [Acanthoscelides obtectus]CAK1682319.1 hypothetical protein AOBTE_LOCUS33564 [Acanthoscelides obtectus]